MTSRALILAPAIALLVAVAAPAQTVAVYAAGSLRGVVAALTPKAGAMGIAIAPTFAGSGDLRDRIERGAKPALLLSADMASPRRLVAEGRASAPAIAFARNSLCLVARRSLGLTPANLVARLLDPAVRIRTSRPIADPSGDYAMTMFDRIDAAHPGAGATLRAKAQAQMGLTAPTPALFQAGRIDVAVTYCSAAGDLLKAAPDLASLPVPAALDPHPVFGLALLSADPAAMRLALLLLSDDGQAALAAAGLVPLSPR